MHIFIRNTNHRKRYTHFFSRILIILVFLINFAQSKAQNIDTVIKKIGIYTENNEFDSIFQTINQTKTELLKNNKKNTLDFAKILKEEGSAQIYFANYDKALETFDKALEIIKSIKNPKLEAEIKSELSVLFYETGDTIKAKQNILEAYEIMKKENFYDIYIASNYGVIMFTATDGKKAVEYFLNELNRVSEIEYKDRCALNNFIGHSYKQLKDYNNSLKHFKIALKYAKYANDTLLISMNYTTVGYSFLLMSNIDSAYIYTYEALKYAKQIDNKFALKDAYSILSSIYYKKNDIKNYRNAIMELEKVKKYFFGNELKIAIAKSEYESKIKLLENQNKLKNSKLKVQFYAFTITSVLLLIAIFFIFKTFKYRRTINEQKIKILNDEKQNAKILNEKLKEDIKKRAKELISKTMIVASYNELQKNTVKKLERLNISDENNKKVIKSIISEIKLNSNEFWDDFFMFFNDIHKDFLKILQKKYPNLTSTEKKIITLLKLNLSTKDISRITYSSVRTIEKHRQNIRKKLSIENNIQLTDFIIKIESE